MCCHSCLAHFNSKKQTWQITVRKTITKRCITLSYQQYMCLGSEKWLKKWDSIFLSVVSTWRWTTLNLRFRSWMDKKLVWWWCGFQHRKCPLPEKERVTIQHLWNPSGPKQNQHFSLLSWCWLWVMNSIRGRGHTTYTVVSICSVPLAMKDHELPCFMLPRSCQNVWGLFCNLGFREIGPILPLEIQKETLTDVTSIGITIANENRRTVCLPTCDDFVPHKTHKHIQTCVHI